MLCEESLGQAFAALGKLWQGFEDERSVCRVSALSEQGACDGGGVESVPRASVRVLAAREPQPTTPATGRKGRVPASTGPASPSCGRFSSRWGGGVGWDGGVGG